MLTEQLQIIECGYLAVSKILNELIANEELKTQKSVILELISLFESKGEFINRAIDAGFSTNTDIFLTFEKKLKQLKNLPLSRERISQSAETVIDLGNSEFTRQYYDAEMSVIKEKEQIIKNLSTDIELLTENNKILSVLANLTANRSVVIEYRNRTAKANHDAKCPICGSDLFATIDENSILKEADDYIQKNGEAVKLKAVEKSASQNDIDIRYRNIINRMKDVINQEKEEIEKKIGDLKILKEKTDPYFSAVQKLRKKTKKPYNPDELTIDRVQELLFR